MSTRSEHVRPGDFRYQAETPDGSRFAGVLRATGADEVRQTLSSFGLRVLRVRPPQSRLLRLLTPEARKVKAQELVLFCRQLAVFVHVGIPVTTALQTIGEQTGSARLRSACIAMVSGITRGDRLSDALRAHSQVFPALLADMVAAAEASGNLDGVLRQASRHIEREAQARQKIKGAMIYPAIICSLAIVISIGLIVFVLPQFRTLYESLGASLPGTVTFLLAVSDFVGNHSVLLLLAFLTVFVATAWWLRTDNGRFTRDRTLLKTPLVGPMLRTSVTERFCRILGDLLGAGVPIGQTLTATTQAVGNRVYSRALGGVVTEMTAGEGLFRPLRSTGLFQPMVLQMIKVGEETGSLDLHLAEAAEMNAEELDYRIKRMTSILEPGLIVFVGAVVGFIAVTMFLAIYSLAGSLQ